VYPSTHSCTTGATFRTGSSCPGTGAPPVSPLDEVEAARRGICLRLAFQTWIIGCMFCEDIIEDGEKVVVLAE